MIFADLVAGDAVFVDANTLTYHFQPHAVWGLACSDLLQRIALSITAGSLSLDAGRSRPGCARRAGRALPFTAGVAGQPAERRPGADSRRTLG